MAGPLDGYWGRGSWAGVEHRLDLERRRDACRSPTAGRVIASPVRFIKSSVNNNSNYQVIATLMIGKGLVNDAPTNLTVGFQDCPVVVPGALFARPDGRAPRAGGPAPHRF